MYLIFLFNK